MDKIPTAKDFVKTATDGLGRISSENAEYLLHEFAVFHLAKAVEAIKKKATTKLKANAYFDTTPTMWDIEIDMNSIENAYPLTNIK